MRFRAQEAQAQANLLATPIKITFHDPRGVPRARDNALPARCALKALFVATTATNGFGVQETGARKLARSAIACICVYVRVRVDVTYVRACMAYGGPRAHVITIRDHITLQPRARSSIALRARGWLHLTVSEDGHVHYLKLVWRSCRRYSRGEIPANPCMYVHVFAVIQIRAISSGGDYSRAASISFRACSGAATIRERCLF